MGVEVSSVRPMTAQDLVAVREVELSAGERFRSLDDPRLSRCADDEPFDDAELLRYVRDGRAWVAVDGPALAGFVVVDVLDGSAHVEEIAVATEFGRRGHGTALLEAVDRWAASAGLAALTLTTFRDVPWNGPWYRALGFCELDADEWTAGLRHRREVEDVHGLSAELRVVMRRELGGARRAVSPSAASSPGRHLAEQAGPGGPAAPSRYWEGVPPSARQRR
jgi:ribosomal protein S18 acetylase RimI-like enzyme